MVEIGRNLGIVPPLFMKGWADISSRLGLLRGSRLRILVIKALPESEIGTWSGNEY
jgi:hypothetical protein